MPILSIMRDWGVNPSLVRVETSDALAQVAAPNYVADQAVAIAALNNGAFEWLPSDNVLVSAADGSQQFNFANADYTTLVPNAAAQGLSAAQDTGVANAYVADLNPAPAALVNGMMVVLNQVVATNTGASTLKTNDAAATVSPIVTSAGAAVAAGAIVAGHSYVLLRSNNNWVLLNASA